MYILHCKECHHEWESAEDNGICDWCGAGSYFLSEHHFDVFKILEILKKINKEKKIVKFLDDELESLDSKK